MTSFTKTSKPNRNSGSKRRASVLGIDIGSSATKMARMERSLGRWTVTNRLVLPTEEDPEDFESALRNGLLTRQFAVLKNRPLSSTQNCVCVLPRSVTDFRSVDVPPGSEADVRQMATEALREHFEDEFDQRTFQTWVHSESASELTTVSCVSIRNSVSELVVEELESVGLKCIGIEGHPFALAKACQLSKTGQTENPIGLLDWGHRTTSLVVVRNGIPEFARAFRDCSGANALNQVAEGLSLSPSDARHILASVGLPDCQADAPPEIISENIQRLMMPEIRKVSDELQKTLLYLKHHVPGLLPGRILLMGGMGCVSNLSATFENRSGIETRPWELDTQNAHQSDPAYASTFAISAGDDL